MTNPTDAERLAAVLAWSEEVDPDDLEGEDTSDLAAVGAAGYAVEDALQALDAAVAEARQEGRSWTEIGQRLGMTRQAARQRWSKHEDEGAVSLKTGSGKTRALKDGHTHHRTKWVAGGRSISKSDVNVGGRSRTKIASLPAAAKARTK